MPPSLFCLLNGAFFAGHPYALRPDGTMVDATAQGIVTTRMVHCYALASLMGVPGAAPLALMSALKLMGRGTGASGNWCSMPARSTSKGNTERIAFFFRDRSENSASTHHEPTAPRDENPTDKRPEDHAYHGQKDTTLGHTDTH